MKPISFYLVTDTHYLNNVLEPGGEAFEKKYGHRTVFC